MTALICVVSDAKKGTSSTAGMQRTVATSPLLQHRIKDVVPARMDAISEAIQNKDFEKFADITMKDSNQFHAVCLDTCPPIFYLNDVSRAIIALVEELNRSQGRNVAAYTFDAGPNAVIYALEKDAKIVKDLIEHVFFSGGQLPEGFDASVVAKWEAGAVKSLIPTRVGGGPRVLSAEEGLLAESGEPKTLA